MTPPSSEPPLIVCGDPISLEQIASVASHGRAVELEKMARERMLDSRSAIEQMIASDAVVYGVNTGFGKLADVRVAPEELETLQRNLIRSHACGLGEPLPAADTRAMLLLRANVLAKGFSGTRPIIAEALIALLNAHVTPVIPSRGSVGASGDLAPLAHLALTLMGEGEAWYGSERLASAVALERAGLKPVALQAKEGLALLNGTQAMNAVGALALLRADRVTHLADLAGAMTLDALRGTPTPFDARIHAARPHAGQVAAAQHLWKLMLGSEIRESHREHDPRVQDAYCLRCMPQVHGAVRGVLAHVRQVLETETGSATDNPLVFCSGSRADVLSGGNFHGAPLAMALDYAAIAITDLMSISERRVDRMVNPDINEGLPPFLTANPGLSSGFMIAHVVSAALLNEAKVLSHPASVDSVPTSGGKEDHVSMGMTSALKFVQIVSNAEYSLAIELMAAVQGLEFRSPLRPAPAVEAAAKRVRQFVPAVTEDRVLSGDIEALSGAIRSGAFDSFIRDGAAG